MVEAAPALTRSLCALFSFLVCSVCVLILPFYFCVPLQGFLFALSFIYCFILLVSFECEV